MGKLLEKLKNSKTFAKTVEDAKYLNLKGFFKKEKERYLKMLEDYKKRNPL